MMSLHSTLKDLADTFANHVLTALRAASLDELLAESAQGVPRVAQRRSNVSGAGQKRRRRTASDLEAMVVAIVDVLKDAKSGLRAEALKEKLSRHREELPLAIRKALAAKRIRKTGSTRATTYFARGEAPAAVATAAAATTGTLRKGRPALAGKKKTRRGTRVARSAAEAPPGKGPNKSSKTNPRRASKDGKPNAGSKASPTYTTRLNAPENA